MIQRIKTWKEVSNGYFRYALSSNVAYEIFIEYWEHGTPIETAKASLCIIGDWYTKDRKSFTEREWLGKELPIQEFPSIAEAARKLNGNSVNIAEYLREPNKRNHAYGYKWKYKGTFN
jgi:hypothetical protein